MFVLGLILACSNGHAEEMAEPIPLPEGRAEAVFAGGCFWCMESSFEHVKGVDEAISGYSGGQIKNPTYHGHIGHLEVIRVIYDPAVIDYPALLTAYWHNIDPTQANGQFCDVGEAYKTAIFAATAAEREAAEASKVAAQEVLGKPVVTPIRDASAFWPAEVYHQDYYKKNPAHYQRYRLGCGRDQRLSELWGEKVGH